MSIGRTLSGDPHSRSLACACTHTHTHTHVLAHIRDFVYDPSRETLQLIFITNTHTHTHTHTQTHTSSLVQESDLLCGWLWPLAQGPSPWLCHQSFKAIKQFSMRIACSSLSKTKRSDSQSHFLPNPIKGEEGKREKKKKQVEDLKWRAFI